MRHVSGMLTDASPRILTAHPVRTGLLLAVIVALMTCIFSTLDSEMTLLHVSGELNLGGFPRLLLACSGICAGLFFSRTRIPYQNLAMYCVTLLSTICIIRRLRNATSRINTAFFVTKKQITPHRIWYNRVD